MAADFPATKTKGRFLSFFLTFLACFMAIILGNLLIGHSLIDLTGKLIGHLKPRINIGTKTT